ncbi:FkbM family methyltransferase [Nannocystaceae bacterium ST9]
MTPERRALALEQAAALLAEVATGRPLTHERLGPLVDKQAEQAEPLALDLAALRGHLAATRPSPADLLALLADPAALERIARERRTLAAELLERLADARPLGPTLRHAYGVLSRHHELALRELAGEGRLDLELATTLAWDRAGLRRSLSGRLASFELVFDTTLGYADQQYEHADELGPRFDEPVDVDGRGEVRVLVSNAVELWRATTTAALEASTFEWLATTITPQSVVYDVGANIGVVALQAWRHRPAQVVAFEPEPLNFARLVENIALNRAENLLALPLALSDRRSVARFSHRDFVRGAASPHAIDRADEPGVRWVACVQERLDALRDEPLLRPPTHLKIDVDGHEPRVLAGAEQTLADPNLRHLLIELQHADRSAVFKRLAQAGFRHVGGGSTYAGVGNYVFERW